MFIEDEHFITSSKVLFGSKKHALGQRIGEVESEIASAVASLSDDGVPNL